ncbi:MAG: hypothetical protein WC856_21540, partial [Methylococcaceae bacterium]
MRRLGGHVHPLPGRTFALTPFTPPIRQNKAVLGCKSTCLLMLCIVYIMRCASLVFLNDRSRP